MHVLEKAHSLEHKTAKAVSKAARKHDDAVGGVSAAERNLGVGLPLRVIALVLTCILPDQAAASDSAGRRHRKEEICCGRDSEAQGDT